MAIIGRRGRVSVVAVAVCAASAMMLSACGSSGHKASGGSPVTISTSPSGKFAGSHLAKSLNRPTFTLTDDSNNSFNFAQRTQGTATLLYFGYTHCPDVCPTIMADIATALRQAPVQVGAKVNVVFVTTDPKRDTPAALRDYLNHFDGDLPRKFIGLTGTQAQIDAAEKAANVPLATDGGATHSDEVLLFAPDDKASIFYTLGFTPNDLAKDLQTVLA